MKKLIALLLAVCMVLGLMTTVFAADEKSNDIVILYTNDVHCAVDDNIGYAGLAAYKKEMQAAYNYVALVDCGDSVQGDVIGTVELKLAGETIGVVNLVAGQDVNRNAVLFTVDKFQEFLHSLYLKVVIALSILSAAIYGLWLLLNAWHGRNAPKKIRRH